MSREDEYSSLPTRMDKQHSLIAFVTDVTRVTDHLSKQKPTSYWTTITV